MLPFACAFATWIPTKPHLHSINSPHATQQEQLAVHLAYFTSVDGACTLSTLRATPHTRLRARDHHASSTLIGGKGGAGPSSLLHTTLKGPTEYVNARWM